MRISTGGKLWGFFWGVSVVSNFTQGKRRFTELFWETYILRKLMSTEVFAFYSCLSPLPLLFLCFWGFLCIKIIYLFWNGWTCCQQMRCSIESKGIILLAKGGFQFFSWNMVVRCVEWESSISTSWNWSIVTFEIVCQNVRSRCQIWYPKNLKKTHKIHPILVSSHIKLGIAFYYILEIYPKFIQEVQNQYKRLHKA